MLEVSMNPEVSEFDDEVERRKGCICCCGVRLKDERQYVRTHIGGHYFMLTPEKANGVSPAPDAVFARLITK